LHCYGKLSITDIGDVDFPIIYNRLHVISSSLFYGDPGRRVCLPGRHLSSYEPC